MRIHLFLVALLSVPALAGCVDRRVDSEPAPVLFESANFETGGLHPLPGGFAAYGRWSEATETAPAIVWLNRSGGVDFSKGLDGTWRDDASAEVDDLYVGITSIATVGGRILAVVSFISAEPVIARVGSDGAWDRCFGPDGFMRLSESQFEGWRAHAAAERDGELAVVLFPPRGENYRVVIVDLELGEVSSRFDVDVPLDDVHIDHIAATNRGWWLGGFDFISAGRPNFLVAVNSEGQPLDEFGDAGFVVLNRRVSIQQLRGFEDSLLVAYEKFGLTRIRMVDPHELGSAESPL